MLVCDCEGDGQVYGLGFRLFTFLHSVFLLTMQFQSSTVKGLSIPPPPHWWCSPWEARVGDVDIAVLAIMPDC